MSDGGLDRAGLERALVAVVTHDRAKKEGVSRKWLRERLRRELKQMSDEEILSRMVAVARQRGITLPDWVRVELILAALKP